MKAPFNLPLPEQSGSSPAWLWDGARDGVSDASDAQNPKLPNMTRTARRSRSAPARSLLPQDCQLDPKVQANTRQERLQFGVVECGTTRQFRYRLEVHGHLSTQTH